MRGRSCLTLLLALALLAICGLSVLSVYGGWQMARSQGFRLALGRYESRAVLTETLRFDQDLPRRLIIDSAGGDVRIVGGAGDAIEVLMRKTAWERDAQRAAAAAEAMQVTVERQGEALLLRWQRPETVELGGRRGGSDAVAFEVALPARVAVEVGTGFGAVELSGLEAAAVIENAFGDVTAAGHSGPLEVRSNGGRLDAQRIAAGQAEVLLDSRFGDILAREIDGRRIELSSSSGSIEGRRLEAGAEIEVESDFGDLQLEELRAAAVTLRTRNGTVTLRSGRVAGPLEVDSGFGDTRVERLEAERYVLKAQSGGIRLLDARGRLELRSDFGAIEVRAAEPVRLEAESQNGDIDFAGPLDPRASHRLHSAFGSLRLALPADSRLDLRLSSDFGSVESELPVELSGRMDGKAIEGRLNGGGSRLEATSQNGDIRIEALSSSDAPRPAPTSSPAPSRR